MGTRARSIVPISAVAGGYSIEGYNAFGQKVISGGSADNSDAFKPLQGIQITESVNHPAWRSRSSGTFRGDIGGDFLTTKRYFETPSGAPVTIIVGGSDIYGPVKTRYTGPVLPIAPTWYTQMFPPFARTPDGDLRKLGQTAMSRISPSNPVADLSTMLGEIVKDGLPHLAASFFKTLIGGTAKQQRKAVADQYLNYEFGWKPLANDLAKIASAIVDADKIWAQYERDAGKPVRRRYGFPDEVKVESEVTKSSAVPWLSPSVSTLYVKPLIPKGQVIRVRKTTKSRWFSGAFIYYLPVRDHGRGKVAENVIQAKKLLGLSLTPDTLWNLAPWSWAVDWFSNVGDQVNNWSNWAIDGQMLLYGYIMEHTVVRDTYTFVGPTSLNSGHRPYDMVFVSETKRRLAASPYGFSVDWSGLTPRQIAIAASLGITHQK